MKDLSWLLWVDPACRLDQKYGKTNNWLVFSN
jgi:hypothetical protein